LQHSKFADYLDGFTILKVTIADRPYVLVNVYATKKDKEIPKTFNDLLLLLESIMYSQNI